jgi:hypothetical protein
MNVEKAGMKGIVRIQLFDKDGNNKVLFQGNKLWDVTRKVLGFDLKIPFITGKYTKEGLMYNTITTAGLSETAKLLGGVSADPISHMAIGIGTGGTTALNSEITTVGGQRVAVTPTSETTTSAGDTIRSVNTYEFTGSKAVTEEGLFNATPAGDMIAYRTFSAINVGDGDSLQITHDIVLSTT